jgi:hypothetical protein
MCAFFFIDDLSVYFSSLWQCLNFIQRSTGIQIFEVGGLYGLWKDQIWFSISESFKGKSSPNFPAKKPDPQYKNEPQKNSMKRKKISTYFFYVIHVRK